MPDQLQTTEGALTKYVAFLRAINVGGHTVKMDGLRRLFEAMGYSAVETFIASGNVIFDAAAARAEELAAQIETSLQAALGYKVATMVRSVGELAGIAAFEPFPPSELAAPGASLYIAFLPGAPAPEAQKKLLALATEDDSFRVAGREVYWLARKRFSESAFSGPLLERTLGLPATLRNVTTVRKLAAKYG